MHTDNESLSFPRGFLWGAATSSHQVEGKNTKNDWWAWEERVQPPEKRSGDACNQYECFEQDWDLLKSLGHTSHRLSIEWSRIEPEEGRFDEEAIQHYRQMLRTLKDRGVTVMLTLHHFTHPEWLTGYGGWESAESVRYFSRFVNTVVPRLMEFVDIWVTINEPGVLAFQGYVAAVWPPQKKSNWLMMNAFWNLARAHRAAYDIIHRHVPGAQVGIANNVTSFHTRRQHSLREHVAVWFMDMFNNHAFYWLTGKRTHDFLGLNYYFHRSVGVRDGIVPGLVDPVHSKKDVSDMGWEIHPSGIFDMLVDFADEKKPIYITENGIASRDDARRVRFLLGYLKEIYHAIQAGADVRGYFHWSLLDNFEWADGFDPKFGLVEVDFVTQKRTPRPSALLYRDIIRANGVPHGLLRYLGHGMGEELAQRFTSESV